MPADMTTAIPQGATGVIRVDLGAVARNWRSLARLVAPAACAAVVKADAYGLGAARVVPALAAAGCETFFVATQDEGIQVRRLAPAATVYVLGGLAPCAPGDLLAHDLRPVLSTRDDVAGWAAACRRGQRAAAAGLHVDTGLNRLGLSAADVRAFAADPSLLASFTLTLVMSHLACADDPGHAMNARQRQRFLEATALLPQASRSLAASDGLMLGHDFHFDLVRPGYALYGGQAFGGGPTPVEPVVQVASRILQVRDVPSGETVGYSATWTARGSRRIATIAAGYADGLFRHLSASNDRPGGVAIVCGTRCPFVGRVSMDLVTLDVTDVPGAEVGRGDVAELIGPDLPIEAVGAAAGTIGYEVLTSLSRRFHRAYVGA